MDLLILAEVVPKDKNITRKATTKIHGKANGGAIMARDHGDSTTGVRILSVMPNFSTISFS